MFRPQESYDMKDPFDPKNQPIRVRRADYVGLDHMIGKFTLSQPVDPEKRLTRSQVGRALHRTACSANVLGTVYEKETKVWKRGCKFDMVATLSVAIHGTPVAISDFMRSIAKKHPSLDKLIQRGYKIRTAAAWGGKPGDIMKPAHGQRYTRFGRRIATAAEGLVA